jgi:hypothetical protein
MRQTLWRTFAAPLLLLVLTIAALVVGLVGDGWLDAIAVIGLAIPFLTLAVYLGRRGGD